MSTTITTPAAEAQALHARRLAAGLTQRQVAAAAEVSLTWLANIEAGCVPARSEAIGRIRRALEAAEQLDAAREADGPAGGAGPSDGTRAAKGMTADVCAD